MMVLWTLTQAMAGDVWLTVEAVDENNRFTLDLPAQSTGPDDTIKVGGKSMRLADLVKAVASSPEGTARSYDVSGADAPAKLTLTHRAVAAAAPATKVVVTLGGANNGGLSLSFDLDKDGLGQAMKGTNVVRVDGVTVGLDNAAAVDAIRRQGPRTLLAIVGPQGGGLRVESR